MVGFTKRGVRCLLETGHDHSVFDQDVEAAACAAAAMAEDGSKTGSILTVFLLVLGAGA